MMTTPNLWLRKVNRPWRILRTEIRPTSRAHARTWRVAAFVTAGMVSANGLVAPGYGQVVGAPGAVAASGPQAPALVAADTLSCKQLKDRLQRAGTLTLVSEQRGWGETFYGPDVPQCEFWSRPTFQYVTANDGPCGVGYICAQRVTGGR